MTKMIASLVDGRICPWYSAEDPIPAKFVVIPPDLLEKYKKGEISDGKTLAKMALAEDGSILGTAAQNVATPPPKAKGKVTAVDPATVDLAALPKGEPASQEVTHFPKTRA